MLIALKFLVSLARPLFVQAKVAIITQRLQAQLCLARSGPRRPKLSATLGVSRGAEWPTSGRPAEGEQEAALAVALPSTLPSTLPLALCLALRSLQLREKWRAGSRVEGLTRAAAALVGAATRKRNETKLNETKRAKAQMLAL